MSTAPTLVLHAPSVHTGGGFVLLQALTSTCPDDRELTALLDAPARGHISLPDGAQVTWVDASAILRLKAEVYLSFNAKASDVFLCFHGLPPLLLKQTKIVVFLQNRLYLERRLASGYGLKTRLRLICERFLSRVFRHRVAEYIVQTPSMQRAVLQCYGVPSPVPPTSKLIQLFMFASLSDCSKSD